MLARRRRDGSTAYLGMIVDRPMSKEEHEKVANAFIKGMGGTQYLAGSFYGSSGETSATIIVFSGR